MTNLKELIGQVGEAMEAGDAEQALTLLEKDAPQHQNAPPFHFVHGTLLYRLTRLDEAINAFQRSTEVGAPLLNTSPISLWRSLTAPRKAKERPLKKT